MPHISLKAEPIFYLLKIPITNSFLTGILALLIAFLLGLYYRSQSIKKVEDRSYFFYFLNFINKSLYQFFEPIFNEKTKKFYPILACFFIYILLNNWLGLLPGVGSIMIKVIDHGKEHHFPLFRGVTADLNTTIFLGIASIFLSQYYSIKYLGLNNYIKRFYDLKNPMSFFIGTLEIVSEFSKILSFSFRLFGNVFAGEVLLTIIAFLIPILAPAPFFFLEIFVGFIQALVFTMLSAVFISLAITKSH